MKPIPFFLLACALAMSCSHSPDSREQNCLKLIFSAEDFREELATKTVLDGNSFTWGASDTVGIYPNTGSQIYFTMQNGAGTSSAVFDGGGWEFRTSAVYYSYYPFYGDFYLSKTHIPAVLTGQHQNGKSNIDHFGAFDYMYADAASSDAGSLAFSYHHLVCVIYVNATNLPAGTYRQLTITAPTPVFAQTGHFSLLDPSPSIIADTSSQELTLVLDNVTIAESEQVYFYLVSAPVDLKDTEITVSILNSQKKQYNCIKTPSKAYEPGVKYGLGCSSWTEVPQSVGLAIEDWGDGGSIGGDAD